MKRVLAIEDDDVKWERVEAVLKRAVGTPAEILRVKDVYDGERQVEKPGWDLLILDVSLDIRRSARGTRGTHDYQAGLKIAERMYYQECEIPTVIVTGFDSFPTGARSSGGDVILGLEDVNAAVGRLLKDNHLGTIRYLGPEWEAQLEAAISKAKLP